MASDAQDPSSSNSNKRAWEYDIFLSFRGEDTRKGFTGHLYRELKRSGFKVFRDDEALERGEVISDKLLNAIDHSLFAVVVLSKNYASSSWCLTELEHILRSASNNPSDKKVFPIFYDVDPSDVRHQTGSFAEAFAKHQEDGTEDKVMKSWKDSLTEVANLSGWHCKDREEAELIDTVVQELWPEFLHRMPLFTEGLIGIENKVQKLESLLNIGEKDVRFVGIWGLPGVGKTTLARAVFEKYQRQFDISCFLHNVRATSLERDGMVLLQNKLISHLKNESMEIKDIYEGKNVIRSRLRDKKVLLLLDDVSHTRHLENLAESHDWFGAGSRVIITTRDKDMLCKQQEVYVHEVETMGSDESLQLFRQKAFRSGGGQEDLLKMSKRFCDYAKGLPLALSVLGSFLCGRNSVQEWEDAFNMLKENPSQEILSTLKLSFYALSDTEKSIFLDIACFFNGWSKNEIICILESCGFQAKIQIATLQEKSMLKEYEGCLVMHDLLKQMGEIIVQQDSPNDIIANRSRLWSAEDIDEVMENKLGTERIQCMVSSSSEAPWHPEAFSVLCNLRLLIITSYKLPHGLKCLSRALKVLHWEYYPLDTLPSTTRLHKLVDLNMQSSNLKKLWDKSMCLENLKILNLSYSNNLTETPDFFGLPNLEKLYLRGCEALVELHASLGQHKKLQVLDLTNCRSLKNWGIEKLEMTSLKKFILEYIQVTWLPEFGESMKNLKRIDASWTNLVTLPDSIGLLIDLEYLNLVSCENLICLPQSIYNLKCLKDIIILGCKKLTRFTERPKEMEDLEEHDASSDHLPAHDGHLCRVKGADNFLILKLLDLSYFKNLIETPDFSKLPNLERLYLSYCEALVELHSSVGQHKKLQVLNLKGCKSLKNWGTEKLEMTSLKEFIFRECIQVTWLPKFGESMKNLKKLDASRTNLVTLPDSIGLLIGLEDLILELCQKLICIPQSIYNLKCLKDIKIWGCRKLTRFTERPKEMEDLEEHDASSETSHHLPAHDGHLCRVKVADKFSILKFLCLGDSKNLIETPDVSKLPILESLSLYGCEALVELHASVGQHKKLQVLNLTNCTSLKNWGIEKLGMTSLKKFHLSGCIQVTWLPKFGESMKNLYEIDASETNLVTLPDSIGLLIGLETLGLCHCKNLICLPQSTYKLKSLEYIDISGCPKFTGWPKKGPDVTAAAIHGG